jgi:hypothetical protein
MELMNINPAIMKSKENKNKANRGYLVMFISLLVMSYILAHFVDYLDASTMIEGVELALWVWLGFFATQMIGSVLWEDRPWKLYVINVGHYLVVLIIMAVILTLWR